MDPKVDGGKWYVLKEQEIPSTVDILAEGCLEIVHHVAVSQPNSNQWKVFPNTNIPSMFNYGHIYHYLVEEVVNVTLCGDTVDEDGDVESTDDTTAKPLRKGKGLFQSGFVTDVQDCHDNSYYYTRSHVHHSMKNDIPLNASATISKISGFIKRQHVRVERSH